MENTKISEWDESYARKENHIFFPKEEVVKFLNRYVRKKDGANNFKDILKLPAHARALDLGCGVGRQTVLMKEFQFDTYGVDISTIALEQAAALAAQYGFSMPDRFIRLHETKLPFEDDFFEIAICDSVLDSMEFSYAREYMFEMQRTVKQLVYISLISSDSSPNGKAEDVVVEENHEHGTIQGYYDAPRIEALLAGTSFKPIQLNLNKTENLLTGQIAARYNIVLQKV